MKTADYGRARRPGGP